MKQGFTLIELLVVVLIIGILSAIALPQYQIAVAKARVVKHMALVRTLRDAQEVYYLANGKYALKFEELDVTIPTPNSIRGATERPGETSGETAVYADHEIQLLSLCNTVYFQQNIDGLFQYGLHLQNRRCHNMTGAICIASKNKDFPNRLCKSFGGELTTPLGETGNYYILPF